MPHASIPTQDDAILARLSSTIVVEESPHGIRLVRQAADHPRGFEVIITLRPQVEEALLNFLLERRGLVAVTAPEAEYCNRCGRPHHAGECLRDK